MNKEEIQSEYIKLLNKKIEEENKIIEDAKKKGVFKPGLDSNKELFKESNEDLKNKINLLKSMLDE